MRDSRLAVEVKVRFTLAFYCRAADGLDEHVRRSVNGAQGQVPRVTKSGEHRPIFNNAGLEQPIIEPGARRYPHPHAVFLPVGERDEERPAAVQLAIERNPVVLADVADTFADANDHVGPAAAATAGTFVEEARDVGVESNAGDVEEGAIVEKPHVHLSRVANDCAAESLSRVFRDPQAAGEAVARACGHQPQHR